MAQSSDGSAKRRRRGPGRPFQPGQSGNPGGRPATKELAQRIAAETSGGVDLVDFTLKVMRANVKGFKRVAMKERQRARDWLADRLWGKAQQVVTLADEDGNAVLKSVAIEFVTPAKPEQPK
jgi:hypothetical protein